MNQTCFLLSIIRSCARKCSAMKTYHSTGKGGYFMIINILHAEVSIIIDTGYHWTFFFFNINSFSYFLEPQNPDFFNFPTPNFRFLARSNFCSPKSGLDKLTKTRYQPIFRHCLGAVLQYLMIFYENQW